MTNGRPPVHWTTKLLLVLLAAFVIAMYFGMTLLERGVRYRVIGRDASGDVLVLDSYFGDVHRLRVPATAEDHIQPPH